MAGAELVWFLALEQLWYDITDFDPRPDLSQSIQSLFIDFFADSGKIWQSMNQWMSHLDWSIFVSQIILDPRPDVTGAFLGESSLLQLLLHLWNSVVDSQFFPIDIKQPRIVLNQLQYDVCLGIRVAKERNQKKPISCFGATQARQLFNQVTRSWKSRSWSCRRS